MNIRVVHNPNGGWDVKIEGQSPPISHHNAKADANDVVVMYSSASIWGC